MDGLGQLLGFMKLPLRYFVGLAVANAFLLLAPVSVISRFGLLELREKGKLYFGLSFLMLCAIVIAGAFGWATKASDNHFWLRSKKKRLHSLTPEEVDVLRRYIEGQTRTAYLGIQSGVARGLEHDHIIYRSSNVSANYMNFAFNIQPWAWNYLNKHRDILGLD